MWNFDAQSNMNENYFQSWGEVQFHSYLGIFNFRFFLYSQ